jgi:hypothetical protein
VSCIMAEFAFVKSEELFGCSRVFVASVKLGCIELLVGKCDFSISQSGCAIRLAANKAL